MKTLDFIKRYWKQIFGSIGSLIGFLFLRQYLQKDLKAKLENQKTQAKDDVLNSKKEHIHDELHKECEHNHKLREDLNKPAPSATMEDVENFYKNRK